MRIPSRGGIPSGVKVNLLETISRGWNIQRDFEISAPKDPLTLIKLGHTSMLLALLKRTLQTTNANKNEELQ